jgi:hypothetical protein
VGLALGSGDVEHAVVSFNNLKLFGLSIDLDYPLTIVVVARERLLDYK